MCVCTCVCTHRWGYVLSLQSPPLIPSWPGPQRCLPNPWPVPSLRASLLWAPKPGPAHVGPSPDPQSQRVGASGYRTGQRGARVPTQVSSAGLSAPVWRPVARGGAFPLGWCSKGQSEGCSPFHGLVSYYGLMFPRE